MQTEGVSAPPPPSGTLLSRLPRVLREGGQLAWPNLLTLLWLNLLWVLCAVTVLLAGPATLTVYGYLAALRDDRNPRPAELPARLRQNLLPGLLWFLTLALFAFLAYANLTFWPQFLGHRGAAQLGVDVVWLFWLYLIWLMVALQPYLLEALAVLRLPFLRAWRWAGLEVARRPLAAHGWVLIPLAVYLIGRSFRTPGLLLLVSLVLLLAAVQVRPVTVTEPPQDEPEEAEEEATP